MPESACTILIADDHALIRTGLRGFLAGLSAQRRVEAAASLDEAMAVLGAQPVDLLLIDLDMPGMHGAASLNTLREHFPVLRIAVLSGTDDRHTIMKALGAGVNGYIPKAVQPEELAFAIESILAGRIYLPPNITTQGQAADMAAAWPAAAPGLTARQDEVLALLTRGLSNKEIARDLNMAEGTVKIHVAGIFRRLNVQNRTEAALRARGLGLA
jgi:DNA-binding NarL/FixJ family response regulator